MFALLPDLKTLVSSGKDGESRIWDSSDARVRNVQVELPVDSVGFGISADSRSIFSVDGQGEVTESVAPEFDPIPRMHLHQSLGRNNASFWETERLAIRAEDGSVEIYDLRIGKRIFSDMNISAGRLLSFVDQGNRLLITDSSETKIVEWNFSSNEQRSWQKPPVAASGILTDSFAISADQQFFALARANGDLLFCDLHSGEVIVEGKNLNTKQIHRIAISPDNQVLAIATGLDQTRLFKLPALAPIGEFSGGGLAMAFSPNGDRLAGDQFKLWDVERQHELLTLGSGAAPQCEFSPDGNMLVARTWQGTLHIWQAAPWPEIEGRGTP